MPSNSRNPLARAIAVALMAAPLVGLPTSSVAQNVDLGNLGDRGFRIDGNQTIDYSGSSVSGAGDVNGDGLADLFIGASSASPGGTSFAGEAYVVFGKADGAPLNLGSLGSGGFQIVGADEDDFTGARLSGAGDVNGDGLADLIVAAFGADPDAVTDAGQSFVIFGKADNAPIEINSLAAGGFRVTGIDEYDRSGISVSGAGDVNGDGLADLIVGADRASPGGEEYAGESYVVFGKADSVDVDLASLGAGGFRIGGADRGDNLGGSVSGAGDVNGDGLADLIVGASRANPGGASGAGISYVVFGKADIDAVDLAALGSGGFRVEGASLDDYSGFSLSGAGDVNGDGLADLIIGAPDADPNGDDSAGESYVVFGKADSAAVDLESLGMNGFRITGATVQGRAGFSVSGAGDVNGDGRADLIIGARNADPGGAPSAGISYVVFGKGDSATVDLANLGTGGFQLDGIDSQDYAGSSVSGAGDVNGDGLADLVIGATGADPGGENLAGESYVVFSSSVPFLSAAVRARSRNGNSSPTAFGVSGDGSNDSTPDARAIVDFNDGADLLTEASTEIVTLTRSAGAFPSPSAVVSWRFQTTREDWSDASLTLRYLDSELTVSEENLIEVVFSSSGSAPFTRLPSRVNPANNTVTATINDTGFYFLAQRPDRVFDDRFEPKP